MKVLVVNPILLYYVSYHGYPLGPALRIAFDYDFFAITVKNAQIKERAAILGPALRIALIMIFLLSR